MEEDDNVDVRDWFTVKARQQLPAVKEMESRLKSLEIAMEARMGKLGCLRSLHAMPGVGKILGAAIWVEIGDARRFPSAQHLSKYAGLAPQVQSSGGKSW